MKRVERSKVFTLYNIPSDVWYEILTFLNIYSLSNCREVCRFLNYAVDYEYIQKSTLILYNNLPKMCCGKRTKKGNFTMKKCLHKKNPSVCCAYPFIPKFIEGTPFIKNESYYYYKNGKNGYTQKLWVKCKDTGAIQRPTEYKKRKVVTTIFGNMIGRYMINVPHNENPGWLRSCEGIRIGCEKLNNSKFCYKFLGKVYKLLCEEYSKARNNNSLKTHMVDWLKTTKIGLEDRFI